MLKVLIIRSTPETKGAGIDVYCHAIKDLFHDDRDINILPITDYQTKQFGLLKAFYKWKPFIKSIKDSNADVLHINEFASFTVIQAFIAAIITKKRVVYTAHWHPYKHMRRPLLAFLLFNVLVRWLVKFKADTVITINNEDTRYFQSFHKNVVRIPHWLRFENINRDIPKHKKLILFVGRVDSPNKCADYIYTLPLNKYEIHVVGKGDVPNRSDLIQHINLPKDELANLFARASLLIVPSKYEAFSYVSLEALAFKTPIVVSDGVRISDYLDGLKWGSVFNHGDYNGFIKAVENTIGMEVDVDEILNIFSKERAYSLYKSLYITN